MSYVKIFVLKDDAKTHAFMFKTGELEADYLIEQTGQDDVWQYGISQSVARDTYTEERDKMYSSGLSMLTVNDDAKEEVADWAEAKTKMPSHSSSQYLQTVFDII
tara:strand:+ start:626 stop:940 length:315 start_codon:yes stop_codon:yes gene_type:complete